MNTVIRTQEPQQPVQTQQQQEAPKAGENVVREFSDAMKKGEKKPGGGARQEEPVTPQTGDKRMPETSLPASGSAANLPRNNDAGSGPRGGAQGNTEGTAAQKDAQAFSAQQSAPQALRPQQDALRSHGQTPAPGVKREESMLNTSVFSSALRRESRENRRDALSGEEGQSLPRGDAVLAGLAGQRESQAIAQAAQPLAVENTPRIDGDLTAKLVDRILVSATDAKGNAEVRISLREDILPGTEIRIQRHPDGGVQVHFVTNDIRAEQMLGQSRIGDLQNVLSQSLQVEVRVATIRTDGSMTADAGTGGEQGQQGRGGQDGQPRDGRSRQHDLFEGMQENAEEKA